MSASPRAVLFFYVSHGPGYILGAHLCGRCVLATETPRRPARHAEADDEHDEDDEDGAFLHKRGPGPRCMSRRKPAFEI